MAKRTNRAASALAYVAALGLAFGASAAHWELTTDNDKIFAAESLGDGSAELTLGVDIATTEDVDEATRVNLLLVAPDGVGINSEVTVTFTLDGALFGNTVQISDFESNDTDLVVVNGTKEGGRSGDDHSVSVRFKAMSNIIDATVSSDDDSDRPMISLDITAIQGANRLATPTSSVTVSAVMELYGTTSNTSGVVTDFPIGKSTNPGERNNPATDPVMEHLDLKGNFKFKAPNNKIASSVLGVVYAATAGPGGEIMIDDRTKLVGGSIALGTFKSTPNTAALDADGDPFSLNDGGDANISITVEGGNVSEGDTIHFESDGEKGIGDKEKLAINGSVATGSFRLDHAVDGVVHYAPAEDNELGRGSIATTFQVVYDSADVKDPAAAMATVNLEYSGVDMKARAYAIPNPDNMDTGNVRIKCEVGGMLTCTTFIECDPQEGGDALFGEVGEIAAGATMHLQAGDIATLLGEDSWTGRLACDVLSDRNVSVQVLVRSDNSLVNNTYVDDMSSMTELAAAVDSVMTAVGGVSTAVGAVGGKVDTAITAACDGVSSPGTDSPCFEDDG